MDMETTQSSSTTAKLPILKQNEYDLWWLKIEQYFMMQDYALWDIIKNGDTWKEYTSEVTNADGSKTSKLNIESVINDEKAKRKNDLKALTSKRVDIKDNPNQTSCKFGQNSHR
jgi:hypothetical protein